MFQHTIALETGTGSILLWDTRLRRVTGRILVGRGTGSLVFSPNGRLLAFTTANGLAYSPDGHTLITASNDSTAQVWDLNPGDEIRNLCNALSGPQQTSQWRQLTPTPGTNPCRSG